MSQNTAFKMNRNNNTNNNNRNSRVENGNPSPFHRQNRDGRITRADGSEDRASIPFQHNNGSRGSRDNNRDGQRNPFQRENRNANRSDGGGYKDWKNRGSQPYNAYAPPPAPKEKVLTADDFPALTTAVPVAKRVADTNTWIKPDTTIAERMKERIENEEMNRNRIVETPEDEKFDVIPLSSWMRSKYLANKREEDRKRREAEDYEAEYRWQLSKAMIPPRPEKEMPPYDPDMDDTDQGDVPNQEYYEAEAAPQYEERI